MNDKTKGNRTMWRAGALAAAAGLAVLATACSGGAAPASVAAPTYAQELALAQCMRGHGVPDFPDPRASGGYGLTSSGSIVGSGGSPIDINSSQAQSAYGACRHLLPGGPTISQLEQDVQQAQESQAKELPAVLKWEQCVRGHGVPNFPKSAVNPNSPQFQAALSACHHLLPPGVTVSVNTKGSKS